MALSSNSFSKIILITGDPGIHNIIFYLQSFLLVIN
jgi:hypothetical protein